MSLSFKNNLEEMRENNPADEQALKANYNASEYYETPGHVRNICFVWPDGSMKSMNYAFLLKGEYFSNDGSITLIFTSAKIILKGYNLIYIFKDIHSHSVKELTILDARYESITDNKIQVSEILFEEKN